MSQLHDALRKELGWTDQEVAEFIRDHGLVAGGVSVTEPQWEACKVCGGDHWTKDHHDHCDPRAHKGSARTEAIAAGPVPFLAFIRECVTANPGGYTEDFRFLLSLAMDPAQLAERISAFVTTVTGEPFRTSAYEVERFWGRPNDIHRPECGINHPKPEDDFLFGAYHDEPYRPGQWG